MNENSSKEIWTVTLVIDSAIYGYPLTRRFNFADKATASEFMAAADDIENVSVKDIDLNFYELDMAAVINHVKRMAKAEN